MDKQKLLNVSGAIDLFILGLTPSITKGCNPYDIEEFLRAVPYSYLDRIHRRVNWRGLLTAEQRAFLGRNDVTLWIRLAAEYAARRDNPDEDDTWGEIFDRVNGTYLALAPGYEIILSPTDALHLRSHGLYTLEGLQTVWNFCQEQGRVVDGRTLQILEVLHERGILS